jgi:hypothetical protein
LISSITNLEVLRAGEIIHFPTRKYPLILSETRYPQESALVAVRHVSSGIPSISPSLHQSFLSDTPAHERTVTAEITLIIGTIYRIRKCNFYLVPARNRAHPSIIQGSYPVRYLVPVTNERRQAFTMYFEAFFRTNVMSYRIYRIKRTEGSLKNKISAV